ncbi:AAA family ATPase [Kangiella taiwanensis]|uniref:MoxR family ATPase n=1 Tax=Kangiella taiwanensis TaxID=1079179 RepID=A0ABP8HRY6_9GAMM|nr:MoxR family ATPase [Kangiella taiwanensis]
MSTKEQFIQLDEFLKSRIIGQESLVHKMIIALLADGHLLVEGAPGLAKTRAIKELSTAMEGSFHRVQFTPDLLPADLTGTEIYRPQDGSFHFQKGPLFHNLILADEINRAPAKVQSALLEAMAERQITVGRESFDLPAFFLVMATQNPIEQEGTYPLPEAQLDRFLMHVEVGYPDHEAEAQILAVNRQEALSGEPPKALSISQDDLFTARKEVLTVHMAPEVEQYLVQLIIATRDPEQHAPDLANYIEYGASPRATIALDRCARAQAWLDNRDYVTPGDVQSILGEILRHRIILSYQAEAEGVSTNDVIEQLIRLVPTP